MPLKKRSAINEVRIRNEIIRQKCKDELRERELEHQEKEAELEREREEKEATRKRKREERERKREEKQAEEAERKKKKREAAVKRIAEQEAECQRKREEREAERQRKKAEKKAQLERKREEKKAAQEREREEKEEELERQRDENEDFLSGLTYCLNCRRTTGGSSAHDCLEVDLSRDVTISNNMMNYKFCLVDRDIFRRCKNENGVLEAPLCVPCRRYLKKVTRLGEDHFNEDWTNVWPAFFWQLLSSSSVKEKHGINIWSVIPKEWRKGWLPQFKLLFDDATMLTPKSVVRDITKLQREAQKLETELKIFEIERHWDRILRTPVSCPFGCEEFVHKTTSFPIDILYARALDLSDEDIIFVTKTPAVEIRDTVPGIRDDYLTFPMKHCTSKLNNPKASWEVLPALAFLVTGEPQSQLCRSCKGGSKLHFLHPPRNPIPILCPPNGEILAGAKAQSRIVKHACASSFSNRYQMLNLQGHVNGIDTIRVTTEPCNMEQEDQMSIPFDSLALNGREDTRAHLINMCREDSLINCTIGDNWMELAGKLGPINNFADYYESATYVPAEDALKIEVDGKTRRKTCLVRTTTAATVTAGTTNPTNNQTTRTTSHFTPVWPRFVTYVHPFNEYGCKFPCLYTYSVNNTNPAEKNLWMVCGVLCMVGPVWNSLAMKDTYDVADLDGYMLTFAGKICFPNRCRRMGGQYPFKLEGCITAKAAEYRKTLQRRIAEEGGGFCEDLPYVMDMVTKNAKSVKRSILPDNTLDLHEMMNMLQTTQVDCLICTTTAAVDNSLLTTLPASWELRFVGGTRTTTAKNQEILCRHGGPKHKAWYTIGCHTKFVLRTHFPENLSSYFEGDKVIVFVRGEIRPHEDMRLSFLESIGGQSAIHCDQHKSPLIVHAKMAPTDTANAETAAAAVEPTQNNIGCCHATEGETICSKTIGYSCPMFCCETRLCTKHMKIATKAAKKNDNRRMYIVGNQHTPAEHEEENSWRSNITPGTEQHVEGGQEQLHFDNHRIGTSRDTSTVQEHEHGEDDNCSRYVSPSVEVVEPDLGVDAFQFESLPYHGNFPVDRSYPELPQERLVMAGFFDCEETEDFDNGVGRDETTDENDFGGFGNSNDVAWDEDLAMEEEEFGFYQADLENGNGEEGMENDHELQNNGPNFGASTTASLWNPYTYTLKDTITSVSGLVILNHCGTLLARGYGKLRPSTWQGNFLQRFIATTPGRSIPLMYAEATLFPRLFWKDDEDLGFLGALPTAFLASNETLAGYGVGSVPTHMKNRIRGYESICSQQHDYLCFAYDSITNLSCRGEDTRLVIRRGGPNEDVSRKKEDKNLLFDSDSIESRPHVNQLCAKMREGGATYFGSHSGNHRDHFGLKSIKEWIDSRELFDLTMKNLIQHGCTETTKLEVDVKKAILNASAITMLRHWQETTELYMKYICHSPEKPLGKVTNAWYRHEYQECAGNLSHLHFLLWIDRSEEDITTTLERIRGGVLDFITPEELDSFVADGMKVDPENEFAVKDLADQFLSHLCSERCMKRVDANGNKKCRVTNYGLESPDPSGPTTAEIDVEHSEAASEILIDLGMMERDQRGVARATADSLKAYMHYPKARAGDGKFSPCNNRLFAATKSNQNLTFVTGYFASRYVAKYSAKIDESNRVYIGAGQQQQQQITLDLQHLNNTKVTGSKINAEKNLAKRKDSGHPTGRAISIMEMMQVILGYDMVFTDIVFEYLPTRPLGERPGYRIEPKAWNIPDPRKASPEDLDSNDYIATYVIRNEPRQEEMKEWQTIAPSETIIVRDTTLSNTTIDKITIFGLRPPELRFVTNPEKYFKWFCRSKVPFVNGNLSEQLDILRQELNSNIRKSRWVDSLGYDIQIREKAIPHVLKFLREMQSDRNFYCKDHTIPPLLGTETRDEFIALFEELQHSSEELSALDDETQEHKDKKLLHDTFIGGCSLNAVDRSKKDIPIVWYDSIPPTQGHRFIVHLLLSMGNFDNELNLFAHPDMRTCFEYAGLIPTRDATITLTPTPTATAAAEDLADRLIVEIHCKSLLRLYIEKQLLFQPCGTKQFDRYVVAAWQTIRDAVLFDELSYREMPSCLYSQLVRGIDIATVKLEKKIRRDLAETIVESLEKKGLKIGLTADQLVNATIENPINFAYGMEEGDGQSRDSFQEQNNIINIGKERFTRYMESTTRTAKGLIINGGPGTGKTTLMELLIAHGYSLGLRCVLTAVMSERASQLGGIHISRLMSIPVRKGASPGRIAEMAFLELLKTPERLGLLRRMDVLFIDEFGAVSAELLSTMDMIMRRVRNSSQFMGGILVMGTYDYLQLPPVEGRPPLLSPHMLTSFLLRKLEHSVRAGKDANLQMIQAYTRLTPREFANVRVHFMELIKRNCKFVDSFNDKSIPPTTLRMFGKKSAATLAIENLINQMRVKYKDVMVSSKAKDYEASIEGVFVDATATTSKCLSRLVKEPEVLWFYPGALYEVTFNNIGQFSQAQLAVLREMPNGDDIVVDNRKEIKIVLAPAGCKSLPQGYKSTVDLELEPHNWTRATIGICPERIHNLYNGVQARRSQYGLKPRIASTIHSGMGQDLPGIVTRVTSADDEKDYHLWAKEQVIVLLSRTHYAKDIIFVGDPNDTATALANCLSHISQYSDYMAHIMGALTNCTQPLVDPYTYNPYRMCDYQIPNTMGSFCYNLVSLGDPTHSTSYIGQTSNLARRFAQHNQRQGAITTADISLIPWALMGFVSGFDGDDRKQREDFEHAWQVKRGERQRAIHRHLRPDEIGEIAAAMIASTPEYALHLTYTRCGSMH
jgi:hypothetical protein